MSVHEIEEELPVASILPTKIQLLSQILTLNTPLYAKNHQKWVLQGEEAISIFTS